MGRTILQTIHGSHLYGLNHAASDEDWYYVDYRGHDRAYHTVKGGLDVSIRSMESFLKQVMHGSPQALEALFSEEKIVDPEYAPMLENSYAGGREVFETYERTIKAFSYGDFKMVRHSYRLRLNLWELRKFQRFNPRLDGDQIKWVNEKARLE